ncbi:hypothetical protein AVEN_6933-1 [Araneus ventricosus]|uniref:Uncharacterized protein n=1 Tax=Araneus ventricosus TaxID=182803 RepID=A0A4Y2TF28_ARAVE|nr:hypothetical protein AVEN_6933-1 [Araneus ventricosus]
MISCVSIGRYPGIWLVCSRGSSESGQLLGLGVKGGQRSSRDKEKGLCLSPFAVQKELKSIGDDPKTVKKLKSGELLIETFSAIQTKSFLLAKTLANIPITVEPHRSVNSCRGVKSEIQLQNTPENEIFEVAENKTNSVVASKFWKTSPLQVSNPVSVQVSNSPKSKANAEGVAVDNRTLSSAATTEPELMATDNVSIHSSDNETESDNAIEYNPHKTIDETPPVLQQQPSTSTTVADKTAFKQS